MPFPFDLPSIPSLSFLPSREQWGPRSWRLPQASQRLGRGQPSEGSWAGCEIWRGEIRQRQRKEAHSQEPRENLQLLWRRWDRLKALVFCTALLFSGFISEMKEVGNDFLCILLQEASRHIFWLYSSLCLLSLLSFSLTPERFSWEASGCLQSIHGGQQNNSSAPACLADERWVLHRETLWVKAYWWSTRPLPINSWE